MTDPARRWSCVMTLVHAGLFSIYLSLVIIVSHEMKSGKSWSNSLYRSLFHPRGLIFDDDRGDICSFLLVWGVAVVLFVVALVFASFPGTRTFFAFLSGLLSVVLYPGVCLLQNDRQLFLWTELLVSIVLFVLFVSGKSPLSRGTNIALLILHFVFWAWLGGGHDLQRGWYLLWPRSSFYMPAHEFAWLVYPLLACSSALFCMLDNHLTSPAGPATNASLG